MDLVRSCFSLCAAFGSARSHYSVFTDQFLQNFLSGGGPRLSSGVCVAAASDIQNKLSAVLRASSTESEVLCKVVSNAANFLAVQLNADQVNKLRRLS